MMQDTTIYL